MCVCVCVCVRNIRDVNFIADGLDDPISNLEQDFYH